MEDMEKFYDDGETEDAQQTDRSYDANDSDAADSDADKSYADMSPDSFSLLSDDEHEENDDDLKEDAEDEEEIKRADSIYGKQYTTQEWTKLIDDYQHGDPAARAQASTLAVAALRPFVISTATKYYSTYMKKWGEDIIGEGELGLMESLQSYNPSVSKPTTWCFRFIIHRMRDFVDQQIHHRSVFVNDKIRDIKKTQILLRACGQDDSIDQVQIATKIPKSTIDGCYLQMKREADSISANEKLSDDSGSAFIGDRITSNIPGPEDAVMQYADAEELLHDMEACLTKEEMQVLCLAFNLDFEPDVMVSEIGLSESKIAAIMNMRKPKIRIIINQAEEKLSRYWSHRNKHRDDRRERGFNFDHPSGILPSADEFNKSLRAFTDESDDDTGYDPFNDILDDAENALA